MSMSLMRPAAFIISSTTSGTIDTSDATTRVVTARVDAATMCSCVTNRAVM